jgi:hypothetical protein
LRASADERAFALGAVDALKGLPWALAHRRVVPVHVEEALQRLEDFYAGDWAARPFATLKAYRAP